MKEKTNVPNMLLDTVTQAVINTDLGGYHALKQAREDKKRQFRLEERVTKLEQMVESLVEKLKACGEWG